MVKSDSTPNTWAHVAAKGDYNRHSTVDNRIKVVLQSASLEQESGIFPTADDLRPKNAPLDYGGEQHEPNHQRRHDQSPKDEDANPVDFTTFTDPQEVINVDAELKTFHDRPTRENARPLRANTH